MKRSRSGWLLIAAVVAPMLTCAVLSRIRGHVSQATGVLVLVLIVVAAASTGRRAAGLLAAVSSAVWFDFFLTRPYQTFAIDKGGDLQVTVLLLLIGAAVSELALWGRREQRRASERAGYLSGVKRVADAVALHDRKPEALRAFVAEQIKDVLGITGCRYTPGPNHDSRNAVLLRDGTVTRNDRPVDVERDGLPTDEEIALPVTDNDRPVGYFVLSSATTVSRPTLEQRMIAVLLAEQVGRLGPTAPLGMR